MEKFILSKASDGLFVGPIYALEKSSINNDNFSNDKEVELDKFLKAIDALKQEISSLNNINDLSDVVLMILEDDSYVTKIKESILNNTSAVKAINDVSNEVILTLSSLNDSYLSSRADDIKGIKEKLLNLVSNFKVKKLETKSIIVGEEISVIDLLSLEKDNIGAIVSFSGSVNSHVSVIANEWGIPYLFGSKEAVSVLTNKNCKNALIDGFNNLVVINPDEATIRDSLNKEKSHNNLINKFNVFVNISNEEDLDKLSLINCNGVGLFRTEFLFTNSDVEPSEEKQYLIYKKVLEVVKEKPVTIRTMDIGSDKQVKWLNLDKENNPALGLRGIRLSLKYKDLFKTQLRALFRASIYGNLNIMFPFITSSFEIDQINNVINEVKDDLSKNNIKYGNPKIGIMVETPSACLIADELASKVDFFSIGTNDLSQYTLAIDRDSRLADEYLSNSYESVYKLVDMTVKAAKKVNIDVCICGQMAMDKNAFPKLYELGIKNISIPVAKILNNK